jgi:alpha-ribazole phosphatase
MSKIHLIRHGMTEANKGKMYYGSTDVPLSSEGVNIIADLAAAGKYPKAGEAMLYTTGLLRTEQTFFLIYGCKDHREIPELREYKFGDFEMKTHEQLLDNEAYQAWINDNEGMTPCPNGESPVEFRSRISAGFADILEFHQKAENRERRSIIVCHGGVISHIMGICFPNVEKNIFQWQPEPGRGYTIHIDEGEPVSYDEI